MALIEARHLTKIFGRDPKRSLASLRAGASKEELLSRHGDIVGLNDVSFSVEPGETFVVMGLSGSGKSTLIRHLNRLIDPTEGTVSVDGTDLLSLTIRQLVAFRRARMAMVFQRFGLLPHRTVAGNIAYPLALRGVARAERRRKALGWIEAVGLKGYEDRYPSDLSGGMQQRVGLARALCADVDILLMDEAFSALDPLIRAQMQELLMGLQARLRKTIVFITHDLDEALRLADRIAILRDGELAQIGTPVEILLKPADAYVRAFARDVNRARVLTVAAVMEPPAPLAEGGPSIADSASLAEALPLSLSSSRALSVIDRDGRLVGLLSAERLGEILTLPKGDGAPDAVSPLKAAAGPDTATGETAGVAGT